MRCLFFLALIMQAACQARAAEGGSAELIASEEAGWPQWRGPRRDGISHETGLLQAWPEGGPKLLWTAGALGSGWVSPIVTHGTIYIAGEVGEDLCIFALDLNGKQLWKAKNGAAWKGSYPGARASCAYSDGHVYHLNAHGRLACLEAATGREVWAANILERFEGQNTTWAISECVVVDGPRVYVTPGGKKAFMAALDKKTGETIWTGQPLENPAVERTGYASPILFKLGGRRLLATLSLRSVVCVDAGNGMVQWTFAKKTRYDANCATPVLCGDGIFHTNPIKSGGVLLKVLADKDSVRFEKAWECGMDNVSGSAVFRDGFIYGSGHQNTGWVCMDAKTGAQQWDSKELAPGSLIYADNRLYCFSEQGIAALLNASPKGFEIHGRFQIAPAGTSNAFAHPVLADGRLYLRFQTNLYCYDARKSE